MVGWAVNNELGSDEGSCLDLIWGYIPAFAWKQWRKSQICRSTDRDLNQGPPEYVAGVITTQPGTQSFKLCVSHVCAVFLVNRLKSDKYLFQILVEWVIRGTANSGQCSHSLDFVSGSPIKKVRFTNEYLVLHFARFYVTAIFYLWMLHLSRR
jgi:hypothetical protein